MMGSCKWPLLKPNFLDPSQGESQFKNITPAFLKIRYTLITNLCKHPQPANDDISSETK